MRYEMKLFLFFLMTVTIITSSASILNDNCIDLTGVYKYPSIFNSEHFQYVMIYQESCETIHFYSPNRDGDQLQLWDVSYFPEFNQTTVADNQWKKNRSDDYECLGFHWNKSSFVKDSAALESRFFNGCTSNRRSDRVSQLKKRDNGIVYGIMKGDANELTFDWQQAQIINWTPFIPSAEEFESSHTYDTPWDSAAIQFLNDRWQVTSLDNLNPPTTWSWACNSNKEFFRVKDEYGGKIKYKKIIPMNESVRSELQGMRKDTVYDCQGTLFSYSAQLEGTNLFFKLGECNPLHRYSEYCPN